MNELKIGCYGTKFTRRKVRRTFMRASQGFQAYNISWADGYVPVEQFHHWKHWGLHQSAKVQQLDERKKHIDVKPQMIPDYIENEHLELKVVVCDDNAPDNITKSFDTTLSEKHREY